MVPLIKCVSDVVFVRKGAFKLNISTKKDTTKDNIINISSLKQDLKIWDTLFELIQIEVLCSKNCFKISLFEEAGASGNHIEIERRNTPKIEKI